MHKSKPLKVPTMKTTQLFVDWKKELNVWQSTNTALNVDKKVQAGILFDSLSGLPQQIVLSQLSVDEIVADDGVKNIVSTLDDFLLGDQTKIAYDAIRDLMTYNRSIETSIDKFIVEFRLKVNKIKASGIVLPDAILGYTLMNCANLNEEELDLVKLTCDEMTYKNVITQIKKISLFKSNKRSPKKTNVDCSNIRTDSFCNPAHSLNHSGFSYNREINKGDHSKKFSQEFNFNLPQHYGSAQGRRFCKRFKEIPQLNVHNRYNIGLYTDQDPEQLSLLVGETLGQAIVDTGCPLSPYCNWSCLV